MHRMSFRLFSGQLRVYKLFERGILGIHMGRKITIILKNGTELAYRDARVVEGNSTWIYQVNKNEYPEELLAIIDPNHIRTLHTEEE